MVQPIQVQPSAAAPASASLPTQALTAVAVVLEAVTAMEAVGKWSDNWQLEKGVPEELVNLELLSCRFML